MNISRPVLKNNARIIIKTAKPSILTAGLIFLAVSIVLGFLSSSVLGVNITSDDVQKYLTYSMSGNYSALLGLAETMRPPTIAYILNLLIVALLYIVEAGFIIFIFNTVKSIGAVYGNLLDGFGLAAKLILLAFLQWLFIFLWALPFIFLFFLLCALIFYLLVSFGGQAAVAFLEQSLSNPISFSNYKLLSSTIVFSLLFLLLFILCVYIPVLFFSYRYRMGKYILLDHPDMDVMDCIRSSKQMMKGHKWEFFVLELSFIGWKLLNIFPYISYIVKIWTIPYINTTYVLYYMALAGKPVTVAPAPSQNPYM